MNQQSFLIFLCLGSFVRLHADFNEKTANLKDLPEVPAGFQVTLVAKEPLVRNPCSMAFDEQGRLFVGMGPQYRNPKPDTPRDSVVELTGQDESGVFHNAKVYATGFNCIQGLAWHGRDLWVANSPDLTVVRDLDDDGVADEYVKVYTDLGNIEHALHGLVWAPDGRLYMSKGNSKGVSMGAEPKEPGRIAPKAFRELWGVTGPAEDAPPPVSFKPSDYRNTYQDPRDDWGAQGGVLRCEDMGKNLQIIARGFRNPWDIGFDSGFNWLGTDNDQNQGDRIMMPFAGANFGWGHAWSGGWNGGEQEPHVPPISGPVFQGSGTGIVFARSPAFPKDYQGLWLINDWLRKTTFVYRPKWEGALIMPEGGEWQPFIDGSKALYRPTDMAFGEDGSLYVLGWGREYGGTFDKDGGQTNEGRIWRITTATKHPAMPPPLPFVPVTERKADQLLGGLESLIPAERISAADELVRRGDAVKAMLFGIAQQPGMSEMKQTWAMWTLGRIAKSDASFNDWLAAQIKPAQPLNTRIQALRMLGERHALPAGFEENLDDAEPRIRFETLQAIRYAKDTRWTAKIIARAAIEPEQVNRYSLWLAFRDLLPKDTLMKLLGDERSGVRRSALLALLDLDAVKKDDIRRLIDDRDAGVQTVVQLALGTKPSTGKDKKSATPATPAFESARNIQAESKRPYKLGVLREGEPSHSDRSFVFKTVPFPLVGSAIIQTANADDHSTGRSFLTFDVPIDTIVHVAQDIRHKQKPDWMEGFADTDMNIVTDDTTFHLWSKNFPAGKVTLGGNVASKGKAKGVSQYFVVLQPQPLPPPTRVTTIEDALALTGVKERGEGLFFAQAGCANCHRVGARGTNFGPDLSNLGQRLEPKFIAQSILDPSAVITEGFAAHSVEAKGKSYFGILLEEDQKNLTLGLADGSKVKLTKKMITSHQTLAASPMPPFAAMLGPQHVADLMAFLRGQPSAVPETASKPLALAFEQHGDVLDLVYGKTVQAGYHTRSDILKRPFFANVRSVSGRVMTRPFPVTLDPKNGGDHFDMHPGIWLGFGDINGTDFWRNKGTIEHLKFTDEPVVKDGVASFATLNRLVDAAGAEVARQTLSARMQPDAHGWLLHLETELWSDEHELSLGAQEEMGLGIRMAPDLIEKAGGTVRNSLGDKTAKSAWGKPAAWWDYSKDGAGIFAAPDAANPLPSWGHTRDYGVMVINPTPRLPPDQRTVVKQGSHLRMKYDVLVHDSAEGLD